VSPEPPPLAFCRDLSKTYETASGGIEALHGVDADFRAGEITAVVGASGSGKSTLLRAFAGLDRPSSGSLVVDRKELAAAGPGALRRHRREVATFVSQKAADNFVPHLTMREQDDGRAVAMLGEFGLGHRIDARPIELSGGEQARAAFALALARGTTLVITDEPTAELDRGSAGPLLTAIREHAGAGVAFVIATHDDDVIAIADRVIRLDRGRIVEESTVQAPGRRPAREASGDAVLAASGLSKSYRRGPETIHALVDGTLDLGRGQVGALLGRSGSGKSTLLALLSGLAKPDAGAIHFALSSNDPAQLPWRELAFLPQRFGLLPELSVRENVEYPVRLTGGEVRGGRVEMLLERLGLTDLAERPPFETSIGQQQRTALARALVLEPAVLLADEPTSHQDAGWRDAVWQVLVEAAEAGTSCLIATHEEQIAQYATRVWKIESGVVRSGG
jgi:putative ABC transport system ATP-binding protein